MNQGNQEVDIMASMPMYSMPLFCLASYHTETGIEANQINKTIVTLKLDMKLLFWRQAALTLVFPEYTVLTMY